MIFISYRESFGDSSQMTRVPPGVENWISRTGSDAMRIGESFGGFGKASGACVARTECRRAGLELFTGCGVITGGTSGAATGVGTAAI
jgi:hypothetical protein